LGSNVYVVGNIYELGKWDTSKAIGPFFNNTQSIGKYPTWFYDINLPAGCAIEYKYIQKDNRGKIIWESGSNHSIVSPAKATGTYYTRWQSN
ncbi:MAG TPA: alpha-amylase, partial [Lachnospiraceae bacterium]|nr:alpha-amylase [Lachnospiraceae bacterium]